MTGLIEEDVEANDVAEGHIEVRLEGDALWNKCGISRLIIEINLAVSRNDSSVAIEDDIRVEDIESARGTRTRILRRIGTELSLTQIDDNIFAGIARGTR